MQGGAAPIPIGRSNARNVSGTSRTILPPILSAIFALLIAALWLWIQWCRVPATSWNDVRLVPVFMAAAGEPVYTLPGHGVITTWMYGPVPLWLWAPAALATGAIQAVLAAGMLNIAYSLLAIGATCLLWPSEGADRIDRTFAIALTCLVWPEATFRFLQSDNLIVCLGLSANLILIRASQNTLWRWAAGLAMGAALGCKPTAIGILIGQLLWLAIAVSRPQAWSHLGRTLTCGTMLAALAGWQFGWRELWFGAFTVPSKLPWADSLVGRLFEIGPVLTAQFLLPLPLVIFAWRKGLLGKCRLLLPVLSWSSSLPFGIAGVLTVGGSINNLHGFQILAPTLLVCYIVQSRRYWPHAATVAGLLAAAALYGRIQASDHVPVRPAIGRMLATEAIARENRQRIWMPWAPLVTYFSDGRFYHAEDGIYVRFITGHPVSSPQARAHVPRDMSCILFPGGNGDWGVAEKLAAPGAVTRLTGGWKIVQWPDENTPHNRALDSPSSRP